jgi:hypothetical protein
MVKSLALPALLLLTAHAYSQDMKAAEHMLSIKFQRIAYWRDCIGGRHGHESIDRLSLDGTLL